MTELLKKLQYLNIPRREGEVYLALLQKKEFSAFEISRVTSVSRTKSYEILQNLIKKGLCTESFRNGTKVFSCIDPKIVMENILSEYEDKKMVANELQLTLKELFEKSESIESPLDYIEVLTDNEQIREKWFSSQKNIKKELLGFTKQPFISILGDNLDEEKDMIKNKVIVKNIFEYKDLELDEINNLLKIMEKYQKIGEEVQIIKELPMKLIIIDDTITLLALNDRISLKPTITTVVINHPSFAKAQKEVFESYWQKSISIEDFKRDTNKYLNTN